MDDGSEQDATLETTDDLGPVEDVEPDTTDDVDAASDAKPDTSGDTLPPEDAEPPDDTGPQTPDDKLGAPCPSPEECPAGVCVDGPMGPVCTHACDLGCPLGWACKTPDQGDQPVCAPSVTWACLPCESDGTCGGDGDFCVTDGDGAACSHVCAGPEDCGPGYDCLTTTSVDGAAGMQCLPQNGSCGCTEENAGVIRSCAQTNGFGTCGGTETCDPAEGWIDCTAAAPAQEICDDEDNDCDQQVDEGFADKDGDGVLDCLADDGDGDGIPNGLDNCPTKPNPVQADLDQDGMGDACDPDDDGDGVADPIDNCPKLYNSTQGNIDQDALGDACDPDMDGDGVPNEVDCQPTDGQSFPGATEVCDGVDNNCNSIVDEGSVDTDGDGLFDCIDTDDDNDGEVDEDDCAPLDSAVSHLAVEVCNGLDDNCDEIVDEGFDDLDGDLVADCVDPDVDGDGDANESDCAPANPAISHLAPELCDGLDNNCNLLVDEGYEDGDGDGLKDCTDPDDDNDGDLDDVDCAPQDPEIHSGADEICDWVDNDCSGVADDGLPDQDGDGIPDCYDDDYDNDGVVDTLDNCPEVPNGDQANHDTDLLGDACDPDDDNDGVLDEDDNSPEVANPGQEDSDGDGIGDASDPDDDNDGVLDEDDNCPELANPQTNTDGDLLGDLCDPDDDNDGVLDEDDNCPLTFNPNQFDADADGVGNACAPAGGDPVCGNGFIEPGEECDEGFGNSEFVPDACRPDCTNPVCGDGVPDSGETCDDGNDFEDDGCDSNCAVTLLVGVPLPYSEDFDAAQGGGWTSIGWKTVDSPGTGASPWAITTAGVLGVDAHAHFAPVAGLVDFESTLVSRVLTTVGVDAVTLGVEMALQGASDSGDLLCEIVVSQNGGLSWTSAWQHALADGPIEPGPVYVDLSADGAQQPIAQVGFRVSGADSQDLAYWEIDNVVVSAGAAPVLDPIETAVLIEGETLSVALGITDLDTALDALNVALVDAPGFVSATWVVDHHALEIAAQPGDAGYYGPFAIQVSDGDYQVSRPMEIFVVEPAVEPDPPVKVVIRDAPGGGGAPVGAPVLELGESLTFYAAGYDATLNYVGEVDVLWSTTGSLDPVAEGPSSSVTLAPVTGATSGTLVATVPDPTIEGDTTGNIIVQLPPPGEPDPAKTTLTADKTSLISDGVDNTTVHIWLFDATGQALTDSHDVVFATTLGTLTGEVGYLGGGHYSQGFLGGEVDGVAVISATVDTVEIDSTVEVNVASLEDLVDLGISVIDCSNYVTFKDLDLLIEGGEVAFDATSGCSPMSFGSVVVGEGGVMTHSPATTETVYRVDMEVDDITIDAGGCIDVSARGYTAGMGWQNDAEWASTVRAGGSHGGEGSPGDPSWHVPGLAYGNLRDPRDPGASAGPGNGPGEGGGVARVLVREGGYFVLNGCVRADGRNYNAQGGGGAGGSIRIHTPHLSGTGELSAIGGQGYTNNNFRAGGGGGGRVAITGYDILLDGFAPGVLVDAVRIHGGNGWGQSGGSGTLFLQASDEAYGTLVANNDGLDAPEGSTPLISIPGGTTDEIAGNTLTDFGAVLLSGYFVGTRVRGNVAQGDVPTLTDDEHFLVVGNDGTTITIAGVFDDTYAPLQTYRGLHVYDHVRVLGQARMRTDGDLLVLDGDGDDSPDVFDVEGSLEAKVVDLVDIGTVRVASGSLDVEDMVSGKISNFPYVTILEDATLVRSTWTAASLDATDSDIDVGILDVTGELIASGGTMLVDELVVGTDLTISDAPLTSGTVSVSGNMAALKSSTVEITQNYLDVAGNLQVGDGTVAATLTHSACTADDVRRLVITANSMTVHEFSSVDVTGRGYLGGKPHDARGAGNLVETGAAQHTAGSHAGRGGNTAAEVYGLYYSPTQPGGGGGGYDGNYAGGAGGGVIDLQIATFLTVHGGLHADGAAAIRSSGGAGGTIHILAQHAAGEGQLTVRGGNGWPVYNPQHGGGGGRISLVDWTTSTGVFDPSVDSTQLQLRGGSTGNGIQGGSGTFFTRAAESTWGTLVVDNEGLVTPADSTPLGGVGAGIVDVVEADTLTDYDGGWTEDTHVGSWVNPHSGQGGPGLADDQIFQVTSNTETSLTFGQSGVSDVAAMGSEYRAIHIFDGLAVRGLAQLFTAGDVLVLNSDPSSDSTDTFYLGGQIHAATLDLNQVTEVIVDGGSVDVVALVSHDQTDYAMTWTGQVGDAATVDLKVVTMDVEGGSLTAANLTADGDLRFDGTTAWADTIVTGGDLILDGGSTLDIALDALSVGGTLFIREGSSLRHAHSTADDVRRLDISANAVVIDAGSSIDVSGRGYPRADSGNYAVGWNGLTLYGSGLKAGGSHGGRGGGASGLVYDDLTYPSLPGGSGANWQGNPTYYGGAGGGVVLMNVTTGVAVNGTITADAGSGYRGAGGAGGSVRITCNTLSGTGEIRATGASGQSGYGTYGGGGGRVAVLGFQILEDAFSDAQSNGGFVLHGGTSGTQGAAGTLYMRNASQQYGNLIIDGEGYSATAATELIAVPEGAIETLTDDTITDLAANWPEDFYLGALVDVAVDPTTASLADVQFWEVSTNSQITMTFVEAGLFVATAQATPYRGLAGRFDNLEIRGNAKVTTAGDLMVVAGDLHTGDDATFEVEAGSSLQVEWLDLGSSVTSAQVLGTITAAKLTCADCGD